MLRNHELLTVDPNVADGFVNITETVCTIQVSAQCGSSLIRINPRIIDGAKEQVKNPQPALAGSAQLARAPGSIMTTPFRVLRHRPFENNTPGAAFFNRHDTRQAGRGLQLSESPER